MAKIDAHILSTKKKSDIAHLCFSLLEILYDDVPNHDISPDLVAAVKQDAFVLGELKSNLDQAFRALGYVDRRPA